MSLESWGEGEAGEKRARWAFVADFGEYAGNYPAEFAAWVIGRAEEDMEGPVQVILDAFREQHPNTEEMMNDLLGSRQTDHGGLSHYALAPTPGRRNNGMGKHGDVSSGFKSPAYESIAIFLDRKPTDEELAFLVKRARSFHEAPKTIRGGGRKPLRCRLVKEALSLELIPLD